MVSFPQSHHHHCKLSDTKVNLSVGLFGTPHRMGWIDWYPVKEQVLDGFDPSKGEYCFVDVGGGKGHECKNLLDRYPDLQGKLVTQDLPFVIDDIYDLDPRIEKMPHDFTTPQSIKGARAYFLQVSDWHTLSPMIVLSSSQN
jgi:hypothetical protein